MIEGQESQSEKPVIQISNLLIFLSFVTGAACIMLLSYVPIMYTDGVGSWPGYPPWDTPTVKIFALTWLAFLQIPIRAFRKSIRKGMLFANGIFISFILLWLLVLYLNARELFNFMFH